MEIRVYDRNLMRKGTIENFTSLQWHRKYYDCGTFELHCPITENNLELLQPGNIIAIKGKKEAAVIRGDQTEEESNSVNEIVRMGYFLPIYFDDRLTGPMYNFSGTVEDGMRHMIRQATEIPYLQIAEGTGDATKIVFQVTYKNLLTNLSMLAKYIEVGMRVVPDFTKKTMTFETYKGVDRTRRQGENPRVIFSERYSNLNQAKHTYSDSSLKTKVIVGGQGEGEERTIVTVGGGTGFDLREIFLDATDINPEEMTEAEYLAALEARGFECLLEHKTIENFEAEVEAAVNFIYGKDYDLGDIVTVQKEKWGKQQNLRITEICEVYENGGMYIVPTFGEALPIAIKWEE